MTTFIWNALVADIFAPEIELSPEEAEDILWNETGFPYIELHALQEQLKEVKERMLRDGNRN